MSDIKSYIESNKDRFLEELFDLIRIPSVSSKEEHKEDMYKAAEYLKDSVVLAGADKAEIHETKGHPVLYAEKIIDPSLPTVLVYGHYDVQPPEPLEKWDSEPFEPEIRDGKIYARGADDDKGQLFMHVKAFEYLVKNNRLPCNVKFMIEGEEEIGSPSLATFCKANKELLASDMILVSDTTMLAADTPSITTGLRGLAFMEVELSGPSHDLHSGLFGGAVDNPANVLSQMIASLTDEEKRVTIPGFYDDVIEVSREERDEMAKAPYDEKAYKQALKLRSLAGEKGYTSPERTGIRPSLDVNGIWSGYTGKGAKTVLPAKASAKISMRLVPNQEPEKIAKLFEEHFVKSAPDTVDVKVQYLHGGHGYVSPVSTGEYLAASKAMEKSFGKKPVPVRSGGSIPIISLFEKELGVKSILLGFGLEADAIHSPNENYPLYNFYKGIETISYFYEYYKERK